jgi:hypothetical protein
MLKEHYRIKQENNDMPIFVWIAVAAAMLILAGSAGVAIVRSAENVDKIVTPALAQTGQNFLAPCGWGVAAAIVIVSLAVGLRVFRKK